MHGVYPWCRRVNDQKWPQAQPKVGETLCLSENGLGPRQAPPANLRIIGHLLLHHHHYTPSPFPCDPVPLNRAKTSPFLYRLPKVSILDNILPCQRQDEARCVGVERLVLVGFPPFQRWPCPWIYTAPNNLCSCSVVISVFAIVILSVLGSLYGVRSLASAPRPSWPHLAPGHRQLSGFFSINTDLCAFSPEQ